MPESNHSNSAGTTPLGAATQALRERYTGECRDSSLTRARVLNSLRKRRTHHRWYSFALVPAIALLAIGSAYAHSSGKLDAFWQKAANVRESISLWLLSANDTIEDVSVPSVFPQPISPPVSNESAELAVPPKPTVDSKELPSTEKAVVFHEPVASLTRKQVARKRSSRQGKRSKRVEKSTLPQRDPELLLFRKAHDLHYSGKNSLLAVGKYQEYLRRYPAGRFVPEAHYNLAVNHLKLGDYESALAELEPISRGRYGSLRQQEAKSLLKLLRRRK